MRLGVPWTVYWALGVTSSVPLALYSQAKGTELVSQNIPSPVLRANENFLPSPALHVYNSLYANSPDLSASGKRRALSAVSSAVVLDGQHILIVLSPADLKNRLHPSGESRNFSRGKGLEQDRPKPELYFSEWAGRERPKLYRKVKLALGALGAAGAGAFVYNRYKKNKQATSTSVVGGNGDVLAF